MNEKQVLQDNLQILKDTILNYPKNLIIAYLNLNSIRNKINDLRILIQYIPLDYFVLSKIKLDKSSQQHSFRFLVQNKSYEGPK